MTTPDFEALAREITDATWDGGDLGERDNWITAVAASLKAQYLAGLARGAEIATSMWLEGRHTDTPHPLHVYAGSHGRRSVQEAIRAEAARVAGTA